MSNLSDDMRKQVEEIIAGLSNDEDFMPTLIVRDHQDRMVCVGLMMPESADAKNVVAGSMAAVCAVYRAKEVMFATAAWMVKGAAKDGLPAIPLSMCDTREEVVMVTSVQSDLSVAMFTAAVIRESGKVGVGLWEQMPDEAKLSGRFLEAMKTGIKMAAAAPPRMAEFVDAEVKAGREDSLLHTITQLYVRRRAQVSAENGDVVASVE